MVRREDKRKNTGQDETTIRSVGTNVVNTGPLPRRRQTRKKLTKRLKKSPIYVCWSIVQAKNFRIIISIIIKESKVYY